MTHLKPDHNLPLARPFATDAEIEAVVRVLNSGWWSTGPEIENFENDVCQFLGGDLGAVALNSCTSGLFVALKALGVGPGDEVLVPTLTFAATSHVVEWCGATPILCDVDPATLNISIESIQRNARKQTKAIIPVHVAGYPCELDLINDYASEMGLYVIEDAAHAIGTKYKDTYIGYHLDCSVFSFYAIKNLACGEGGMVVSTNQDLLRKIRSLSYFGIDKKAYQEVEGRGSWYYQIRELGYKFNMDQIHASIGRVQLSSLEAKNERRRAIASLYDVNLSKSLGRPCYDQIHTNSCHLYPVFLPEFLDRDHFILALKEKGIGSSVHFIPLHRHPYFAPNWSRDNFPGAEAIADKLVSLPLFPEMSGSEVEMVIDAVNSILKENNEAS